MITIMGVVKNIKNPNLLYIIVQIDKIRMYFVLHIK